MPDSQNTHNTVVPETAYPIRKASQHPNQTPDRLNKKVQLLKEALQFLNECFIHSVTPQQAHWLIDKSTLLAYPAETESIADHFKTVAFHHAQIDLPRSIIDSAITLFRQQGADDTTIEFGHTLMRPDGSLYLRTIHGVFVYDRNMNSAYFAQSLPLIGFITPEQSPPLPSPMIFNVDKQTVSELFELINIPQDSQLLIITWIIQSWLPQTPNVLLELVGERRCGKSTALSVLKRLIDNSNLGYTRTTPQTQKSVHTLAQQHILISLDQVDELNSKVQNCLLNLMNGDIIPLFQKRQKHEINVYVKNSVILNSIDSVVTEPTLADSTITIELPPIANAQQLHIGESNRYIHQALLAILGDVHATLNDYTESTYHSDKSPAMTTFCNIGCAVAKSLGFEESVFWQQFDDNQQSRFEIALEELPVAYAIRKYMQQESITTTDETVGKLSEILLQCKPEWAKNSDWPATPRSFGDALRKAQPILKQHQILLEPQGKRGGNRRWKISQGPVQKAEQLLTDSTKTVIQNTYETI